MMTLNVNIDHVATIRQARGGSEPDPITAALNAELAGASGIVCHLREDRRHAQDRDVRILRETVQSKLDLEMGASEEIIKIALEIVPDLVTLVPENRQELTTEGGLNVAKDIDKYKRLSERMHRADIDVSFFVEPEEDQINAAMVAGADMVELHTGTYANTTDPVHIELELERIQNAAEFAFDSGLQVAAGHGLNYLNVQPICLFPQIKELSIGHSIISRALFVGIKQATREMLEIMNKIEMSRICNNQNL
jgi:pyridoxine 5-phosphate synthase